VRKTLDETTGSADTPASAGAQRGRQVDIEELAERVYRLMREEARLERARLGQSPQRRER
jgi:hypothetical protein